MLKSRMSAALAALCVLICLLARADSPGKSTLPKRGAVGVYILGPRSLVTGTRATYRVAVHWATAPGRTGPLRDARVSVTLKHKGSDLKLAHGRTDVTGNADLPFEVPRIKTGAYTLLVTARTPLGDRSRSQSIQVFPGGRLLLTTDKSLYQPEQVIHVRALALRGMDLKPVGHRPIRIQVSDPKGNVVYLKKSQTSRFGVASLDFQLADEINLGRYTIAAWTSGGGQSHRTSRTVEVKRYALPKFSVSIETDRPYYRPGDTVHGTVRGRYFFGKPVVKGRVTLDIRSRLGRGVTVHKIPHCITDRAGLCRFQLRLPHGQGTGELRVLARLVDTAHQQQAKDLSLPLTSSPLQLSVTAENDRLIPGVYNRLHVVAGFPDGKPAAGARVALSRSNGKKKLVARTDRLGVASFKIMPRRGQEGCSTLMAGAVDALGQRGSASSCLPTAKLGSVLVRPTHSLVGQGQGVRIQLAAAQTPSFERSVYLDVVKDGQTLATFARSLRRGRATVDFHPDGTLFGLLELRGYRIARGGERVGTSRMIYVEHPGRLNIRASSDRATYRPGGRARISFQVNDSRTGDGVQAALGVRAVDEAVAALGGLHQDTPKIFFTLASQMRQQRVPLRVQPGGRGLTHWVDGGQDLYRRQRAADVLLATLKPAEAQLWETSPWQERREAFKEQAPRLINAALDYMKDHCVGRRTDTGWRFVTDLVPSMARAKKIKKDLVRDPWQRVVRPWHLHQTDASFTFAPLARKLAKEKLAKMYATLSNMWQELSLERETFIKGLHPRQWPLILPRRLPARLVREGKLKASDVVDPWGQPYRVLLHRELYINPYRTGLVSRYMIQSAGPDGKLGTRDDITPEGPRRRVPVGLAKPGQLLSGLIGNEIGESFGVGGLGVLGFGRGGGGSGAGYGYGIGRMRAAGPTMPGRVRSVFPETLLWEPELITDADGRATLEVDLADSITTWKVLATGSSTDGLLGTAALPLKVFQDFFVDLDLPATLTQGDRISVPVTVYNYLKQPQRISLRLKRERWFKATGPLEQTIELQPSQVGVRYFPISVRALGSRDLTVVARTMARTSGGQATDAVRRSTRVMPDGVERATAHAGTLRRRVDHDMALPAAAIRGTRRVSLSVHPGPASEILSGMEGMLRMPGGCFEQTSSTTYPNVLILDYLRRTGQLEAAVEQRAKKLINAGYQRLISFEVPGGGFSWFGNKPANRILTAYGLMEFHDMSRVHPVDPELIRRTQTWLAGQQDRDGGWSPDKSFINEGATNNFTEDRLRITAYIAHALRYSGHAGPALDRAMSLVRRQVHRATDPYTLALLGNLLAKDSSRATRRIFDRLWKKRRQGEKGLFFDGPASTLTHGAGRSGRIESTALAALALLSGPVQPHGLEQVFDTLVASKDSFGSWHSTQATILSLRALLLQHQRSRSTPSGKLQVLVDGRTRRSITIRAKQDRSYSVDLTPYAASGSLRVGLRFAGNGALSYQLVGRYWVPRTGRQRATRGLAISTRYDRGRLKTGDSVRLRVAVRNHARTTVEMPLVALSLPPGFALDNGGLASLVAAGKVDKVQRVGNRALLYLTRLGANKRLQFNLALRSQFPLRVQARPSVVYEYYRPENRAESAASYLEVQGT